MTDLQRLMITEMRERNIGYTAIAKETGLSKDSVKAFCRVHRLGGIRFESAENDVNITVCMNCGNKVVQNPTRKAKKFCSDVCRMEWWNSHPENVTRKRLNHLVCEFCGVSFDSKNPRQKYCSRKCYAEARKKVVGNE